MPVKVQQNPMLRSVKNPYSDEAAQPRGRDDRAHSEEFVALITRHQVALLAFLLSIIPSQQDAEDILQRTNIVLWRKRDQFQPGTNFKAWAFTVARWESLAFLKERKRSNWLVFNDELTSIVSERLASIPDADLQTQPQALAECLARLSETNRRLILDRYQTGRSIKECAERAGRSEQGLRVTLHRIRTALRHCITRRQPNPPA
jgi:RNA polymerase sigma-70 factor (ECF subfamily)